MRILFATDRMHVPDDRSGSVQSTHALISRLIQRDVQCEILASLPREGRHFLATAAYRLSGRKVIMEWPDTRAGYDARRGSSWRFAERTVRRVAEHRPDVLALDSVRQLHALAAHGFRPDCPILVFVHELGFKKFGPDLPFGRSTHLVANSPMTARELRSFFNRDAYIIPPLVELDDYRTDRQEARYVTFISPNEHKGLGVALAMAEQLPEVDFLFVEGWPMERREWAALKKSIRHLRNVRLERGRSDMRTVYRRTRVLIVPSQVPETFGRASLEAQTSGIPVVARDVGSLGHTVGEGGEMMPPTADATAWAEAVKRLLSDEKLYEQRSRAALRNSQRSEFQPGVIAERFQSIVTEILSPSAAQALI